MCGIEWDFAGLALAFATFRLFLLRRVTAKSLTEAKHAKGHDSGGFEHSDFGEWHFGVLV